MTEASSRDGSGIDPQTGTLGHGFEIPRGTDAVVYLSQSPRYRESPPAIHHVYQVNVATAIRVAEMARHAGVTRFLYASTGNVYAPAFAPLREDAELRRDNVYSLSKIHAEESIGLLRDAMDVLMLRLFAVYGPGQNGRLVPRLCETVRSGRAVSLHPHPREGADTGGIRITPCYVDDVVGITSRLIREGGPECLNVASDSVVDIREMARTIARHLGTSARLEVSEHPREGDMIADVSLLKGAISPVFTPFHEGIRRTLNDSPS